MEKKLTPSKPKRWKSAIVTWIAIYPIITLILMLFAPQLDAITFIPLKTLVLTLILVPAMVYGIMPFMQKLFARWLNG